MYELSKCMIVECRLEFSWYRAGYTVYLLNRLTKAKSCDQPTAVLRYQDSTQRYKRNSITPLDLTLMLGDWRKPVTKMKIEYDSKKLHTKSCSVSSSAVQVCLLVHCSYILHYTFTYRTVQYMRNASNYYDNSWQAARGVQ